jgi:hypothetical protein
VIGPDIIAGGTFTDAGGIGNGDYLARWTERYDIYLPLTIKP